MRLIAIAEKGGAGAPHSKAFGYAPDMNQAHAVSRPSRNGRDMALLAVIPLAWLIAMGVSVRGDATFVMACSAGALCVLLLLTGAQRLLVPNVRAAGIGVAAAAVMIAGTYAGYFLMARFVPSMKEATAALYGHMIGGRSSAAAMLLMTGVVIAEEIIWRGVFQSLVAARVPGATRQVLITAAVYAAALITFGSPLLVVTGFVCGVYWSALRSWSGSVVPPLVAHVLWDLTIALLPLTSLE